jgi:NADH-quinone oxidoreductase subunit G
MEIHEDGNVIYRCVPRENMEINKWWLCDEGRFNFRYVGDEHRVVDPAVQEGGALARMDWSTTIDQVKAKLTGKRKPCVLVGSDLTVEEAQLLQQFIPKHLPGAALFHFGTPGIKSVADDGPADKILKRRSKTSNLNGLEKLGYKGFDGLPAGTDAVLVFRGGRAQLPEQVLKGSGPVIGVGVFMKDEAQRFFAVLPGTAFAEKSGTILNYENRDQKLKQAVLPPGNCKALSEILMMWANLAGSPKGKSERAEARAEGAI